MAVAQKDILNGWKEIAGYVARDIRTVERWEKQRGLPVRRVPGAGRATVYARISELEEWLASKPLESEGSAVAAAETVQPEPYNQTKVDSGIPVETPFAHLKTAPVPILVESKKSRETLFYGSLAAAGLAILLTAGFAQHRLRSESVKASPGIPTLTHSAVPGVEDAYLRGRYLVEQRTPESLEQALQSFNAAIRLDPKYAPAYAGQAQTYNLLREYSVMPDSAAYPKAKAAAEQAIKLDPDHAEAHVSLGYVSYFWEMTPGQAERQFQEAIRLDPSSAQAHHWYGTMLMHEGRFPEALRELDIAQRLEPASSAILTSRAFALGLSGHAEQARDMLRDLLSHDGFGKDPNSTTAHLALGIVSTAEPRDWQEQFSQWRQIAALRKNEDLLTLANVAESAFKQGGEHRMWEAILKYERALHPAPNDLVEWIPQAEANLGDLDAAFRDMNRLIDRHDTILAGLSLDPLLVPLHADPRYAQLRARLGLPKLSA